MNPAFKVNIKGFTFVPLSQLLAMCINFETCIQFIML